MPEGIIADVRDELEACRDEAVIAGGVKFFKEPVAMRGVKTATVRRISGYYFRQLRGTTKEEIFGLCEELLGSGFCEDAFIAFDWAHRLHREYVPADFVLFERWVEEYVSNWATCDTFCTHAVGSFIELYPAYTAKLKEWARSPNRWLRRAGAVSLILPARKGRFLDDALEIAGILVEDRDDLVQKGYGWLLKEASRQHRQRVFDFVMSHRAHMPRTALRYAIEKMPQHLREQAMAR